MARFYSRHRRTAYFSSSTLCSAEIAFKTDPKNTDYEAELGASRNFEPWRDAKETEEIDRLTKLEEEENNPMKALENRTVDSKREMDILDALQDIRARNARNERMGKAGDVIERVMGQEVSEEEELRQREAEEDEALVRELFSRVEVPAERDEGGESKMIVVKRKAEHLEGPNEGAVAGARPSQPATIAKKRRSALGIKVKARVPKS